RQHVALLTFAQAQHGLVVGRSLGAAIPRTVGRAAVAVAFAVRLVVLVVVARPVVQGEAVMGGDEIDAGPAAPALAVEYVAGAEQPACQRGWRRLGAPVIAGGVAKLVVPFSPT